MTDLFHKLVEYFTRFPGIGPRQARRFVYFLLSEDAKTLKTFSGLINELKQAVSQCKECLRFFEEKAVTKTAVCEFCTGARDPSLLMLLEKDQDLENIRKAAVYNGKFFILGGLIPILEKDPAKHIRSEKLLARISDKKIKEIIIALSLSQEGEHTTEYLTKLLGEKSKAKISILGRGLSTGTELEYSDIDTLKNALKNRV